MHVSRAKMDVARRAVGIFTPKFATEIAHPKAFAA